MRLLAITGALVGLLSCTSPPAAVGPATHVYPALQPGDTDPSLGFEKPPVQEASSILPIQLREGPHHRVDETVRSDGFLRLYTIVSDYGTFHVVSDELLRQRLQEIDALAELTMLEENPDFQAAIETADSRPFIAKWNLVREPSPEVRGMPEGAWQEILHADHAEADDRGEQEHRALRTYLEFEATKRDIAAHLGVDPYSANPVLQRALNQAGLVVWAGDLDPGTMDAGSRAEKGVVHPFADEDARLAQLLGEDGPEDLRRLNRIELAVMGIPTPLAERALVHPWLTPRHRTIMLASLVALDGVKNRRAFVEAVLEAHNETDALIYQRVIEMLRAIHERVTPIARLGTDGRFVRAYTVDGRRITPVEVDYLVWTRPTMRFAEEGTAPEPDGSTPPRELWLSGVASPKALAELQRRGYQVVERAFEHLDDLEDAARHGAGGGGDQ